MPEKVARGMTFLERRVEHLLKDLREDRLSFDYLANAELRREIARDIYNIQRFPSGRINLSTCTPLVRSLARSQYALKDLHPERAIMAPHSESEVKARAPSDALSNYLDIQREFFAILSEFFQRMTGKRNPSQFAAPDNVFPVMKENSDLLRKNHNESFTFLGEALAKFYSDKWLAMPESARTLGGSKLILGGGQRFPATALNAVRSMLLYADTILIPDPVMPFLETIRSEEKFPSVLVLNFVFQLLYLKPIIDADFPYPPILVVPTFDRRLAVESEETSDLLGRFKIDFLSTHLDATFEDETEIFDFAEARTSDFLRQVEEKGLFYPPETDHLPRSAAEAAQIYRSYITTHRNEPYASIAQRWGDGPLIAQGIMERLEPQFHLGENSEWLVAQPMLWHDAHWHYFKLCAGVSERMLREDSLLSTSTIGIMQALGNPNLAWLGNIPIETLVELRRRGENEQFRRTIEEFTGNLHEAALEDVDRVAAEVSRGIASLVQEHQKDVHRIDDEYRKKYLGHAVTSFISLAAIFLPWIAPLYSPIPSAVGLALPAELGRRYLTDKLGERSERRKASKSLTGVLAAQQKK